MLYMLHENSSIIDMNELCSICFTSALSEEPAVQLPCGHIFHVSCIEKLLKHRWSTLRISFDFMSCPTCKTPIESLAHCPSLQTELTKLQSFRKEVEDIALKIVLKEDIVDMTPVEDPNN